MLWNPPSQTDLEPEVVSIGTCRVLRISRIGVTYFVENMQEEIDAFGATVPTWKVVAICKPKPGETKSLARKEAHEWMWQANRTVWHHINEDRARAAQAQSLAPSTTGTP